MNVRFFTFNYFEHFHLRCLRCIPIWTVKIFSLNYKILLFFQEEMHSLWFFYFFVKYCWCFFYFPPKMRMHCPAVCISCNKEDAAGNEYPGNPGMYVYGMHIHFSRLRTHFVLNKKYNPNFLVILSKEIDPGRIV